MSDYNQTTWVEKVTQVGPTRMNALEAGVDDASKHHKSGTLAARPAASATNKNWTYEATDVQVIYCNFDGSSWTPLASLRDAGDFIQAGVVDSGDLRVTPQQGILISANETLTIAAGVIWIPNASGVLVRHVLLANDTSLSLANDPANATSRIDSVYAVLNEWGGKPTFQYVSGTQQAGGTTVTLDNRTGAGAAPANSVRLRDYLFQNTGSTARSTRERRPRAGGSWSSLRVAGGSDQTVTSTSYVSILPAALATRLECSGAKVRIRAHVFFWNSAAANYTIFQPGVDGAVINSGVDYENWEEPVANYGITSNLIYDYTPSAGSHSFQLYAKVGAGTTTIAGAGSHEIQFSVEEIIMPTGGNVTD